MQFFDVKNSYTPLKSHLTYFLKTYWYIPSDVLQRGIEANIWNLCKLKRPILDIGIGNGQMTPYLFKNQPIIDAGIDNDATQVEIAKKVHQYKKVLCSDAAKMPFADGTFATVVSNSTFEHIEQDTKAVKEVARILKKNGLFYLTVPSNYLEEWILEYETAKNKEKAKKKLDIFNRRANHLHYHSLSEWEAMFKKNSMEIVFSKYYFPKNVALYWYKMFTFFTTRVHHREIWSYIIHSKLTPFIPKQKIISFLEKGKFYSHYKNAFFTDGKDGAQLFMIVKKIT